MEQMTITEALSEINLITKKVEKKKETIMGNLVRMTHIPDPFEYEGGSKKYLANQLQSIEDMWERLERIRSAIATANLDNSISINEETKTIFEWLTWKREVAAAHIDLCSKIYKDTKLQMDRSTLNPQLYKATETDKPTLVSWTSAFDYAEILKKNEKLTTIVENLDGQLSLKNATIVIKF